MTYCTRKKKKSEDFLYSLYKLQESDKSEYKVIVVDNAAIHKSKKVKDYCEARNIILVYLPPYSPDLNPIEKFRKKLKRAFQNIQREI
jgi:transposase